MAVFFTSKQTWPGVTNDVRVSVYAATDTTTPIAEVQKNAPHLDQQFDFPGLPRLNFIYKIYETEIDGSTILGQLGSASFVPANDELSYKSPEDIHIGVTEVEGSDPAIVWPSGTNVVTIPGWIGYEIVLGRNQSYPLRKGVDYSWNAITGQLILLGDGDVFQEDEWFHVEFETIVRESSGGTTGGGSTGGSGFSDILVVTTSVVLTTADIGKKILIAPAGNYLEITLPDYTGVIANKPTYFEMADSAPKCAAIKAATGQAISFTGSIGTLYICPNESFEIYKRVITTGSNQWRIQNAVGNFLSVGEIIMNDRGLYNLTLLDGGDRDYQQFARLYAYVLGLGSQAISYATWSSANILTRMKFSLKDTASSNFRVPSLIVNAIYMRPTSAGSLASDYVAQRVLQHQHLQTIGQLPTPVFGQTGGAQTGVIGQYNETASHHFDLTSRAVSFNSGTGLYEVIDGAENNPNSRVTNFYVRI